MGFNKVFGIGLSRTGTASLSTALNLLDIPTIHFPHDDTTFAQLSSSDFHLRILDAYRGVCDTPVAPYYAQLDSEFAGSKFILTVRERESWLASMEKPWTRTAQEQSRSYTRFINAAVYGTWRFSRPRFIYVYETHLANVQRYFANRPCDLLVLDICRGDGWSVLAPFLDVPMPSIAFPHVDTLDAFG